MEEKIEDILDNNMMCDGQLNKVRAITELLNLFGVDSRRELLKDGLKLSFNQWKEHNGIDYNCGKFEDKYGTRYKTKAIQSMYQDYISL